MTNVNPVSKSEDLRESAERLVLSIENEVSAFEGYDRVHTLGVIADLKQRALELEQQEIANLLRVVESEVFPNEIRVEAARIVQKVLELG